MLFLLSEGSSYMTGAVSGVVQEHYTDDNTNLRYRIFGSMEDIARGSVEYKHYANLRLL